MLSIPNSPESELIILGMMLSSQTANDYACQRLQAKDFFQPKNKLIFEALQKMYEQEKSAEQQILVQTLKDLGTLEEVTTDYIHTSIKSSLYSFDYEEYTEVVLDKSLKRQLGIFMANAAQEILKGATSSDEDIAMCQEEIMKISKQKANNKFYSAQDIISGKNSPSGMSLLELVEKKRKDKQDSEGHCTGLSSGLVELDLKINGLVASNLIVLAARPGVGKTTLALHMAVEVAIRNKLPVGIFSLEMGADQIITKMICNFSGIHQESFYNPDGKVPIEQIRKAIDDIKNAPVYLYDTHSPKITDICIAATRMKELYDIKFLIIDYLQLISGSARFKNSDSRVNEVSEISRSLKILARKLDIPILCLSQLNRAVESRTNHTPMLSDLRESGSIEQDADQVLLINRPDLYDQNASPGKVIVDVAKNRHGATGTVELGLIKQTGYFKDYSLYLNEDVLGEFKNANGKESEGGQKLGSPSRQSAIW